MRNSALRKSTVGYRTATLAGVAWLGVSCLAAVACGGEPPQCRIGADCASGVCNRDGTCALPGSDLDAGDALAGDVPGDVPGGDAGPGDAAVGDFDTGLCLPNHDGVLARHEVTFAPGLSAIFRVAQAVEVDTAGVLQGDGSRQWNLDLALSGDHNLLLDTIDPAGTWWGPAFPDATYAVQMSDGSDLLGVYQATDQALLLLGIVSPYQGAARTDLHYDPAVTVLAFPLSEGSSWSSTSLVSGYLVNPYTGTSVLTSYAETYNFVVDAHGRLDTPFANFPVLRIASQLAQTILTTTTVYRSFAFVSECFGTVGTVTSTANETEVEFTSAAEVKRLTAP